MKEVKKERLSNFELMRIVSMFMIIIWHLITRSNILEHCSETIYLILKFFQYFIIVHVNSFILVTGYFGYKNKFKLGKIISLLSQSLFYRVLFVVIFLSLGLVTLSRIDIFKNVFPFLGEAATMDNPLPTELSNTQKKRRYRKRSEVWNIFAHLSHQDETSPIKCGMCGKCFSFKSTASNLYRHLDRYHRSEAILLSKRPVGNDYNPQLPRLLSQNNISLVRVRKDSLHALAKKSLRIPFSDTTARVYLREQARVMREMVFRESPRRTPFNLCFDGWTNCTGRHIYAFIYRGESPYTCVFMTQEQRDGVQSAEWLAGVIQRIRHEMITLKRVLVSCTSDNAAVCQRSCLCQGSRHCQ